MLRYLYTGEIEFAQWGSAERRKARSLEKISKSYGIPKASPKSVYRLADKVTICQWSINLALTRPLVRHPGVERARVATDSTRPVQMRYRGGAVQQVHLLVCRPPSLGPFKFLRIDRYPELRELELRQLTRVLLSSDSGHTLGVLKRKIKNYTEGQLPHAEHVLPTLYELIESDESVEETPLPAAACSDRPVTGRDWDGLKRALASSLTSGTFLDSQFYAVESRSSTGSPRIRPIYFCSSVGGSFTSNLVACGSFYTWVTCVETLLIDRYRFLKTEGTENATPSVCRRVRQRY